VSGWLGETPAVVGSALVALVLVAESGLMLGVVLPGASLAIGMGVLAGAGLVPLPVAALTVALPTVLGAALGHRAASRHGEGSLLRAGGVASRVFPERALRLVDRSAAPWAENIGRRPVRAAAMAQCIAGARTLAPRIAALAGVPLATMLRGTVPAALVWSSSLVAAGATAGAALPLVRGVVTVVGIPLVIVATSILLRRRAAARLPSTG
jgi:membrane-associated protein